LPLEAAIAADDDGDEVRRPVGARLLDELGRRILSGQYPQGVPLPTELQLCAEFGVSRTAMRRPSGTIRQAVLTRRRTAPYTLRR
jgi:DNA-binding GntR family transcriptional regulator